jgi:hypothetical protein
MPRMLSDIITDVIGDQPDMEKVGDLPSRDGLRAAVETTAADVVLLGLLDSDLPDDCLPVFTAYPSLRMLGVAADGRRAFLYELRPQRFPLGEVSPNGLVEAIRATSMRGAE